MRFSDAKKGKYWILVVGMMIVGFVLVLGFCQFAPTPKTVQKTIVFEAD